jgi:hypothetical protein
MNVTLNIPSDVLRDFAAMAKEKGETIQQALERIILAEMPSKAQVEELKRRSGK